MGIPDEAESPRTRPGPRRPEGAPAGPDEVRAAVLDAAERLFSQHGVDGVSLRDVATEADVQLALIGRYVGSRDELIDAVFEDLTVRLAQDVVDRRLERQGFERDSVMGCWTVVVSHYAITGRNPPGSVPFNPVQALAEVIEEAYGSTPEAARLRGAQIVASALGWRLFEDLLVGWAELPQVHLEDLRTEVNLMHRRIGATPWPTPEDPPGRGELG